MFGFIYSLDVDTFMMFYYNCEFCILHRERLLNWLTSADIRGHRRRVHRKSIRPGVGKQPNSRHQIVHFLFGMFTLVLLSVRWCCSAWFIRLQRWLCVFFFVCERQQYQPSLVTSRTNAPRLGCFFSVHSQGEFACGNFCFSLFASTGRPPHSIPRRCRRCLCETLCFVCIECDTMCDTRASFAKDGRERERERDAFVYKNCVWSLGAPDTAAAAAADGLNVQHKYRRR